MGKEETYTTRGPGMFSSLTQGFGPDAEDMVKERERIQFKRSVAYNSHNVRIFNLHDENDRKAYEALMKTLMLGVQAKTHMIAGHDRQLLDCGGKQLWHIYLEWCEFELKEESVAPIGSQGDTDEQAGT